MIQVIWIIWVILQTSLQPPVSSRILYEPDPRKHLDEHRNYQRMVPVDSIIGKPPNGSRATSRRHGNHSVRHGRKLSNLK